MIALRRLRPRAPCCLRFYTPSICVRKKISIGSPDLLVPDSPPVAPYKPKTTVDPATVPTHPTSGSIVIDVVRQYSEQYPSCVLLVQVGDFYELYEQHATNYASLLDLKLTRKQMTSDITVDFAGFPSRALDKYLDILVNRHDCRVALCEQTGLASRQDASGMERFVTRVITPGTVIDDRYLQAERNNYLLSILPSDDTIQLAWVDVSVGEFLVQESSRAALQSDLLRIQPREIILPKATDLDPDLLTWMADQFTVTHQPTDLFIPTATLPAAFDSLMSSTDPSQWLCRAPALALLRYIDSTHLSDKPRLSPPSPFQSNTTLQIDSAALTSLELLKGMKDGRRQDGLLGLLDRTNTFAGSRLLSQWIAAPLAAQSAIEERLDLVGFFVHDPDRLDDVRDLLRQSTDAQRALQRLTLTQTESTTDAGIQSDEQPAVTPSAVQTYQLTQLRSRQAMDMLAIGRTLSVIQSLGRVFTPATSPPPACVQNMLTRLDPHATLLSNLTRAFLDDLQQHTLEDYGSPTIDIAEDEKKAPGRLIHPDYHPSLRSLYDTLAKLEQRKTDMLQQLRTIGGRTLLLQNQQQPIVEISAAQAKKIEAQVDGLTLLHETKTKRRYHLTAWSELSMDLDDTLNQITQWEHVLLQGLCQQLDQHRASLMEAWKALAELDVLTTFSWLACHHAWTRPEISAACNTTHIVGGRHPVVEMHLARKGRTFIPNDLRMSDAESVWLLTGPNMGGKSTFLRQNALMVIMAHMGSFIPARSATIGLTDRIFSRVGAADNLAQDQSTFLVEMAETATILQQATPRSLVIMDEVGRGTATTDGFSLAYAILQHLHDHIGCRTLFATHYHELADVIAPLDRLACYKTTLYEDPSSFTFLHRIQPGVCRSSHGLKVARLAGLPPSVMQVAESMWTSLQKSSFGPMVNNDIDAMA